MKRFALTLIEVLVGFALAAIVISFAMGYLRQLNAANLQSRTLKREVLARECAFMKLSQVFSNLDQTTNPLRTEQLLDAKNEALFFGFNRELPDPHLPSYVDAELYLNAKNEVHLRLFGKNGVQQDEILLEKVAHLSFSFFCPKEKKWLSLWPKEKTSFPSMLKITITPEGSAAIKHTFPFLLLHGKDEIVPYKGMK